MFRLEDAPVRRVQRGSVQVPFKLVNLLMRKEGLEPSSLAAQASETCVFAISPLPRRRRGKTCVSIDVVPRSVNRRPFE